MDHYLNQLLSGHGCYLAYQKRFGITESDLCPECPSAVEDAEHVFFACPRFREGRGELQELLRENLTPDNIIGLMLSSKDNWNVVADYAARVIKQLREAERIRQRHIEERQGIGENYLQSDKSLQRR